MSNLVLGIDIGYSEKRTTTGACLLSWTQSEIIFECKRLPTQAERRKQTLQRWLDGRVADAVAIDAPLRGTFDPIGVYRDAELMLTRGFQPIIGKPGQASSGNGKKLNESANGLARSLLELNCIGRASHMAGICDTAIVEAFPTTFLGTLLPRDGVPAHGARSDAYFEHLLGPDSPRPRPPTINLLSALLTRLLPNRVVKTTAAAISHHEDRAALICSLTALSVVVRDYVAVGDRRNGYIILPGRIRSDSIGLQEWAWKMLNANRPAGRTDSIIVEAGMTKG